MDPGLRATTLSHVCHSVLVWTPPPPPHQFQSLAGTRCTLPNTTVLTARLVTGWEKLIVGSYFPPETYGRVTFSSRNLFAYSYERSAIHCVPLCGRVRWSSTAVVLLAVTVCGGGVQRARNISKCGGRCAPLSRMEMLAMGPGGLHAAPTRGLAWGATRSEDQQLPLGCSSRLTQLPLPHQCRGQTCHEPDLPMPTRAAVVWWSQVPPCQQNIPLGRSETVTKKCYDSHLFGLVKPLDC
jgi:hypothetical protein